MDVGKWSNAGAVAERAGVRRIKIRENAYLIPSS
jgi:hypothetical protein